MSVQTPPEPSPTVVSSAPQPQKRGRRLGCLIPVFLLVVAIVIAWVFLSPGVFTVQPIGALPEGVTLVYHSRNPEMPFFSSPDALCIQMQGGVSLMCRAMALGAASDLTDRVLLRLPYSHWAYLQSTGGLEFGQ
jgi:hypothetical protein